MADTFTVFFWNLGRGTPVEEIGFAIREYNVDILVLAESPLTVDEIRAESPSISEPVTYSEPDLNKIQIYATGDPSLIIPVFDDPACRLTIRRVLSPLHPEILLAAVHFVDKRNWTNANQLVEATKLAADILNAEETVGHHRTVLLGDLNMNPFDEAVVAAGALHGVMSREIARKQTRIVARREYRFFYNPMWNLLGDRSLSPPGTYFLPPSVHVEYFWHMVDQVLLRPDLMDSLVDVRILDSIDGRSLVNSNGRPSVSDHLPLLIRLQM